LNIFQKKNIPFKINNLEQVIENKGDKVPKKFCSEVDSRYNECMETNTMISFKTGDFETDVRSNYYSWLQDELWKNRNNPEALNALPQDSWDQDFIAYLISMGVPEQYAAKVASYAWQDGHGYGYVEVLNVANSLIDIFN
jgi:hypothetical protein